MRSSIRVGRVGVTGPAGTNRQIVIALKKAKALYISVFAFLISEKFQSMEVKFLSPGEERGEVLLI